MNPASCERKLYSVIDGARFVKCHKRRPLAFPQNAYQQIT